MTYKFLKIFSAVSLSILLTSLAFGICYFIAEKYFFDKFFYYKSISHGYFPLGYKNVQYNQFGDRGKDIDQINNPSTKILGISTQSNEYKIAIFGDSLVWGQGIRNNQRFAKLLENKLNTSRPTKIYSFGNCGDNIFDNYQKYRLSVEKFGKMDLYIFAFYNNDLVLNDDNRYLTNKFVDHELLPGCNGEVIYDPPLEKLIDDGTPLYTAKIKSTDPNNANYCAYKKLVPLIPQNNTIFMDLGSIEGEDEAQVKFSNIIKQDFKVVDIPPIGIDKAHVSRQDGHPSAYVNQIYSEILYKEITSDRKYNFSR